MYVKAKNEGESSSVTKSVRPLDKTVMLLNRKSGHRFGHGNLGHGLAVLICIYIYIYTGEKMAKMSRFAQNTRA